MAIPFWRLFWPQVLSKIISYRGQDNLHMYHNYPCISVHFITLTRVRFSFHLSFSWGSVKLPIFFFRSVKASSWNDCTGPDTQAFLVWPVQPPSWITCLPLSLVKLIFLELVFNLFLYIVSRLENLLCNVMGLHQTASEDRIWALMLHTLFPWDLPRVKQDAELSELIFLFLWFFMYS